MSGVSLPQSTAPTSWIRRVLIYALVLLIGFMLGFLPMWVKSRESASRLSEEKRQAGLATMQNLLASAAIDAQRGDYESARQAASSFFTSVRDEANKGDDSIFSQAQKDGAGPVFSERDQLISLLARNDPAGTERLFELYESFGEMIMSE